MKRRMYFIVFSSKRMFALGRTVKSICLNLTIIEALIDLHEKLSTLLTFTFVENRSKEGSRRAIETELASISIFFCIS